MIPFFQSTDLFTWLLPLLVLLPLAVGLLLLLVPQTTARGWANGLGLGTVIIVFLGAILLWLNFSAGGNGYAFLSTTPLGLERLGARLQLGLNGLSLPMFLVTALVGCAAGFYTYGRPMERKSLFWSFVLLILSGTLGAFACVDLFYAFLFHELALLPTFLALMIFGGRDRQSALVQTGIFLVAGSLITLVGLINFYFLADAHSFSLLDIREHLGAFGMGMSAEKQLPAWGMIFWGCLIFSGLWPFYSWVPKLLTQAPTPVAMLHGGALKFFGLYFLLQGFVGWTFWGVETFKTVLSLLCVANILFLGFAALTQTDLRRLVAYSAVMHLGTLFLALNSYNREALGGMILLMVGSGLATALLLMLSGALNRRVGSTQMTHLGGLRGQTPRLATFLMLGFLALMGLPCFVNFWGELAVIFGVMHAGMFAVNAILAGIVISTAFGVRALRTMLMGEPKPQGLSDLTTVEHFSAWILILPAILFALLPGILTGPLDNVLETLLNMKL